jgi:hypothetical protein
VRDRINQSKLFLKETSFLMNREKPLSKKKSGIIQTNLKYKNVTKLLEQYTNN